ncbi:MAG: TadE/TadG family type IV pilus assembly protein [Pseudomonadota bacterium]
MIQTISNRVRSLRGLTRKFINEPSGAAAIEFAAIAIPFFFLKFAIIELAMVFWASQLLETGVSDAGRKIRTGQAQAADMDAAGFRQLMCEEIGVLFNCDGRFAVDVQRVERFDEADRDLPTPDDDGNIDGGFGYMDTVGGETVIVRAFYSWPLFFNFLGLDGSNFGEGNRLLVATTAFRNEPFEEEDE